MIKYLIGVFIGIFGVLILMYLFVGVPRVYQEEFPELKTPHLYNNPARSITTIKIAAFYFVPQNKAEFLIENWREILENNFKKVQKFHSLQFQERSLLTYEIYPEPIIGLKINRIYDTDITQYGNPQALRSIAIELEKRVLDPAGDLYRSYFAQTEEGQYQSLVIIYEGVGASGSENAALISRTFLTKPEYSEVGASILTHEFYHTLGIPDGYEIPTSIVTSPDIMGIGRFRPLEQTYLSRDTLRNLGF